MDRELLSKAEFDKLDEKEAGEYWRRVLCADVVEKLLKLNISGTEFQGWVLGRIDHIASNEDRFGNPQGWAYIIDPVDHQRIRFFSDDEQAERIHIVFKNGVPEEDDLVVVKYTKDLKNNQPFFGLTRLLKEDQIKTISQYGSDKSLLEELKQQLDEAKEGLEKTKGFRTDLENRINNLEEQRIKKRTAVNMAELRMYELKKLGFEFEEQNHRKGEECMNNYDEWLGLVNEKVRTDKTIREKLSHYNKRGPRIVDRFLGALLTNQIIILSGPSGTGKTTLPQVIADVLGGESVTVSVQSNWTEQQDLFGYYNFMNDSYVSTEFLDTIIKANEDPDRLYIIILDEMNLAHVEYYFANYLSAMELEGDNRRIFLYSDKIVASQKRRYFNELLELLDSDEDCRNVNDQVEQMLGSQVAGILEGADIGEMPIKLDGKEIKLEQYLDEKLKDNKEYKKWKNRYDYFKKQSDVYKSSVPLPDNLQIVGTINMDETTKVISPKIIDRSYIIEICDEEETDNDKKDISGDRIAGNYYIDTEAKEGSEKEEDNAEEEKIIENIKNFISELNGDSEKKSPIKAKMSARQKDQIRRVYEQIYAACKRGQQIRTTEFEDDIILSKILPAARSNKETIEEREHEELIKELQKNEHENSIRKIDQMFNRYMKTYDYWEN